MENFSPAFTRSSEGWSTLSFSAFDTKNSITVPREFESELSGCIRICRLCQSLFNPKDPESDVSKLRRGSGWVSVHPETALLTKKAVEIGLLTDGLFDITIGAAISMWDFKNAGRALPDSEALRRAAQTRCLEEIKVSGSLVYIPGESSVDFGGIAKGYIGDRLAGYLRSKNVRSALIDLGGNVLPVGKKSPEGDWRVGLHFPGKERGEYFAVYEGGDFNVITSAADERYIDAGGTRYHHLLDPASGYPADMSLLSATVISRDGTLADGLSTACFVGGAKKAKELLGRFSGKAEGVLLEAGGEVFVTPALKASGKLVFK